MVYMKFKSQIKGKPIYIGNFTCKECNYNVNVETDNSDYVPKCKFCNKPMIDIDSEAGKNK